MAQAEAALPAAVDWGTLAGESSPVEKVRLSLPDRARRSHFVPASCEESDGRLGCEGSNWSGVGPSTLVVVHHSIAVFGVVVVADTKNVAEVLAT